MLNGVQIGVKQLNHDTHFPVFGSMYALINDAPPLAQFWPDIVANLAASTSQAAAALSQSD